MTKISDTWPSLTKRFILGKEKCYLTVVLDKQKPCRIFLDVSKEGSTIGAFAEQWASTFSLALEHGTPLDELVSAARGVAFEPDGWTDLGFARSIVDYVAQYLDKKFLQKGTKNV